MGMYTPAMLRHWLDDVTLEYHMGCGTTDLHGGIQLLEGNGGPLRPECLYVGEGIAAAEAIAAGRLPEKPVCIICAGRLPPLEGTLPVRLWMLETSLPLIPLYNRVQEQIHAFWNWDGRLQEAVYTNAGLPELLERGATLLPAALLLVNAGFKKITLAGEDRVRDPNVEELKTLGYYSLNTIEAIRRQIPLAGGAPRDFVEYRSMESGNYTIIRRLRYRDSLFARLIVILPKPEPDPCASDLARILGDYIAKYMFSNRSVDYSRNAAIGSLVSDLIELRLTDPEELDQRVRQLNLAVKRYFHVMLVSFGEEQTDQDNDIPWNYIIDQLQRIFPQSNITTYRGEILLMIRKTDRGARLHFDHGALEEILKRYHGQAAVGNFTEFFTSLPPIYHQTRSALRLGRVMHPGRLIYFYEDYSIYLQVELAYAGVQSALGTRNIVYLCHPALIALLLYDRKTGGNLTEALYTYLRNERSSAETAKKLYIHRNTMLYKVRKIESVIGESLEDPWLREQLLFSYHVLEYMQKYRKEDILVLRSNRESSESGGAEGMD